VALAQAAAERAHVADLRPGDLRRRLGQRRGPVVELRQRGQLDAGADGELHRPAARLLDLVQPVHAGQADDLLRPRDVLLLQAHEVRAAAEQLRRAPLRIEEADRGFGRFRPIVGEIVHGHLPPFASAARTRSGENGVSGTRTPMALKMALPIAAWVLIVVGSPMPITPRSGMSIMWTWIFGMSPIPPSL